MADITLESGPIPSLPPATDVKLYIDESDLHLKTLNAAGEVIDVTEGEANTVDSVNGEQGTVVLDADDISDATTANKFTTQADQDKLDSIAPGAEPNTVDSVNGQMGVVLLDADDISDTSTTNKYTSQAEINKLATIEQGAQVNVVNEAPEDGTGYVRTDAAWVPQSVAPPAPVDSVNGQTGVVVLDADDISDASTTNKYTTQADIDKLAGIEDGAQKVFDGTDTEANILASDATALLGETWWATDTKIVYKAVTTLTNGNQWQGLTLSYNEATDSFKLPPTQDGQTQDLGQEVFFNGFNTDAPASELDPKVFLSIGSRVGDELYQDVIKVVASDLSEGKLYGINTTELSTSARGKLITYGEIKNINTSAWSVDDVLYIDSMTAGDLTNVQPEINAYPVAKVLKVDAATGAIFVNSISSNRIDSAIIPVGVDFAFMTGQQVTTTATFYELLVSDPGTVPEAVEVVAVPDNSIVAASQDHLSPVGTADGTIQAGLRTGQIEFEISNAGSNERIYFEVYDADGNGTPVDSGITGIAVGDLGVRPIFVLVTSLLDADSGDIFKESVRGQLVEDYLLVAGNRVRVHVLCEKVGTAGGTKNFTLYFGSDHDSYIEAIAQITIDDVDGLNDALDERVKWLFPWGEGTYPNRTMTRIGEFTSISNKETSDYPVPVNVGDPTYLMDSAVFITSANVSVIHSGHRYTFSEPGYINEIRVQVPALSATTNYRIIIADITNPATPIVDVVTNPVLVENEWVTVALGSVIAVEGSVFEIFLDALDSGASSSFSGGWEYDGSSNSSGPISQRWNRSNNNAVVRVDKTDLDSVDRSTELAGVVTGSNLLFVDTVFPTNYAEFETIGPAIDEGNYFSYECVLIDSGGNIAVGDATTMTATIPVPSSTHYRNQANYWPSNQPSFATAVGFLEFDGVDQPGNSDNGFGVDIKFQQVVQSEDWDLVSISSTGGGGGGGGGVDEAPIDGTPYVRQDAAWVSESSGGGRQVIQEITGDITLTLSDYDKFFIFTGSNPIVVTVPDEATEDLGEGFRVRLRNNGTSNVEISGSDILPTVGGGLLIPQNGWGSLTYPKLITNQWALDGHGLATDEVPVAINDLAATSGDIEQSLLTWVAPASPSPITGYNCQLRVVGDLTWLNFIGIDSAATQQIVFGLSAGNYEFRIAAVNDNGAATWSNVAIGTPIAISVDLDGLWNEDGLTGVGSDMQWVNLGGRSNWDLDSTFGTSANLTQGTKKGKQHLSTTGSAALQTTASSLITQTYTHFYCMAPSAFTGSAFSVLGRDDTGSISDTSIGSSGVSMYAQSTLTLTNAIPVDGTEIIASSKFSGNNSELRLVINDDATDTTVTGAAGFNAFELNSFLWKADQQNDRSFIGDMFEFRVYGGELSAAESDAVIGAFKQKWFDNFPYISSDIVVDPEPTPDVSTTSAQTMSLASAASSSGLTAGKVSAVSIFLGEKTVISKVIVDLQGSSSGNFYVGLYKDNGSSGYDLQASGSYSLSNENGQFITIDLGGSVTLDVGAYFVGFLSPQSGGGNPTLYYTPVTNNISRHAFNSVESNLNALPSTITAQSPLSNMYWAGIL